MREIDASIAGIQATRRTQPGYLIQIDFPTVLRFSTRGEVAWNGNIWGAGARLSSGPSELAGGALECSIQLSNDRYYLKPFVVDQSALLTPVKVWLIEGNTPDTRPPVMIFSGRVTSVPVLGDTVELAASTEGRVARLSPSITIGAPFINNITPRGSVIIWNGERIVLE